jgi:hypothetical protein
MITINRYKSKVMKEYVKHRADNSANTMALRDSLFCGEVLWRGNGESPKSHTSKRKHFKTLTA